MNFNFCFYFVPEVASLHNRPDATSRDDDADQEERDGRALLYDHIKLYYMQRHSVFSDITSKAGSLLGVIASLTGVLIAAVALLIPAVRTDYQMWFYFRVVVGLIGVGLLGCACLSGWTFKGENIKDVPDAEQTYRLWRTCLYLKSESEVSELLMSEYVEATKQYMDVNKRKFRLLRASQYLLLAVVVAMAVSLLTLLFSMGVQMPEGVKQLCLSARDI